MERDEDHAHRRTQTTNIPLQDLNGHGQISGHVRSLSDRGRRLFARGGSDRRSGRYSQLRDEQTSLQQDGRFHGGREMHNSDSPQEHDESGPGSPLIDGADFQQAMGFAGLSFSEPSSSNWRSDNLPHDPGGLNTMTGHNASDASLVDVEFDGSDEQTPTIETDRTPLTDALNTHGSGRPSGQRHNRMSTQSVRFALPDASNTSPRLGDDLVAAEAGIGSSGRNRGLSPGSHNRSLSPSSANNPLQRAGTMMRKMSQRVVNLSNEPELLQQELRKRKPDRRSDPTSADLSRTSKDGVDDAPSPTTEKPKLRETVQEVQPKGDWTIYANPLRGKSLGAFPADSKLRTKLCDLLVHPLTEPAILVLILFQTVLLAVQAAPNWNNNPQPVGWSSSWFDWAFLALFIVYTIETGVRIIVSGFVVNPIEYSTINREIGLKRALEAKAGTLFALQRQPSVKKKDPDATLQHPSILRAFTSTSLHTYGNMDNDPRHPHRVRLAHRAFLRHGFNRLDFVAVVSFWIGFVMAISGFEANHHVHAFRMLSALRIVRLLSFTSGTSIILQSLKKAAPLLLNVALLIGFFWLLFGIVGVQSFKSSLRRNCVWVDPEPNPALQQPNWTTNSYEDYQFCGGSVDSAGNVLPWSYSDGTSSGYSKGYLCPPNSYCVSAENPYNGTVSFDNIFQSLQLVFVTMTSNTFTDIMYYLADSDYLAACMFFAAAIVVMTFWLVNLLIAVITSSFQVIRTESQNSAFMMNEDSEEHHAEQDAPQPRPSFLKHWVNQTYWLWILIITFGLLCQTFRSSKMGDSRMHFIDNSETVVTFLLFAEIIFRFAADWRTFFFQPRNVVDLSLAVITLIIQIPPIHNSGQPYAWLTFFQIIRIYRVVLALPWTRDLILLVLGKVSGILNLIVFVFLLTFLGAIFASQLFRGEVPAQDTNGNNIQISFFSIFNSFLGMYQVFTSENWTVLMYLVTMYDVPYNTAWIGALFFIMWITLAYFIVLNMFIAVIQENFDVSEDEKRLEQVKAFLKQKDVGASSHSTLSLSSMFRLQGVMGRRQDPLDYGPAMKEMLLKDAIVRDFLDEETVGGESAEGTNANTKRQSTLSLQGNDLKNRLTRLIRSFWDREPNPFHSELQFSAAPEDLNPQALAREVFQATEMRKRAQRDYLIKYPNYNVSLFIFKPHNTFRRLCQKCVGPGRGSERAEGSAPNPVVWYAFSAFLYAAIVAMVLLACVTTPIYQRQYWRTHPYDVRNWFVFTDLAFAVLFTIEALIRLVADGFFWTPNAYFRSSWGFIDGIVLLSLWINVIASLYNQGGVSRAVGAFKALRALRLLNVSDSARDTFHSVIVRGGWKILSAAFVSLSLLIPFAIYGLNLFNGQFEICNNNQNGILNLTNCVNEYITNPTNNWNILAPSQVGNPWYSFDNFGDSLYILFSIVSQEGWVNVMWSATMVTGRGLQPLQNASQGNAVFFIVFNLMGTVFVLTLFVSVFMRNYTEQTGVAFLTTEQRSWLELRKLLRQVSPSKRPASNQKRATWQQWCYFRAVRKTGRWQRMVTGILIFHLILLCLEWYPDNYYWERTRDYLFLLLTIFYILNIVVRIIGLTWARFRKSSWDLYSLASVFGTFVTTILLLSDFEQKIYVQLHKLFLVSIVLLLIPRNNQLDQLFKTAAASLSAIANLVATWFVIFLVFAIAFTQTFGLTRFGSQETDNLNFRNVPKALIVLFRMSVGEGWNQIMQDFATISPPFCNPSDNFLDDDCGSGTWARALFILWNIISMYLFVNLFLSLIYESFAYVYQRSSGLSVVSRKEIRNFKQAWAEYDPSGSGFISKEDFPRLLGELSGAFEMRIYPLDFTVGALKEDCKVGRPSSTLPVDDFLAPAEIDLRTLNARLAQLPVAEIRRRRDRLNVFYEEVMVSADPDRGISFNSLLMILAHYKLISDNKSLRLEEFLRRRARLQRVEEAVRRSIVVSFFDTLYWSRRFRRHMDAKRAGRMTELPQLQVPEIFVEDEEIEAARRKEAEEKQPRPSLSLQIPTIGIDSTQATGSDAGLSASSSHLRNRNDSIQLSPSGSPNHSPNLSVGSQRWQSIDIGRSRLGVPGDERRSSDQSDPGDMPGRLSADQRRGSRANSSMSAQDMLDTFDQSAWGQSIRRSFTLKRGGGPGSIRRSDGS